MVRPMMVFNNGKGGIHFEYDDDKITHWMYLPKAPK